MPRQRPGKSTYTCLALSAAVAAASLGATAQDHNSGNMEEIVVKSRFTTNDRLDTATGLGPGRHRRGHHH